MIRHDLTYWPLVVSRARGTTTLDDQLDFLAHGHAGLIVASPSSRCVRSPTMTRICGRAAGLRR